MSVWALSVFHKKNLKCYGRNAAAEVGLKWLNGSGLTVCAASEGVEILHLQQVQCCSTRIRVSGHLLYMQVLFTPGVHFRSSPEHKSSCKRSKGRSIRRSRCHSAFRSHVSAVSYP